MFAASKKTLHEEPRRGGCWTIHGCRTSRTKRSTWPTSSNKYGDGPTRPPLLFFSSYPCRHIHPFSINKPSGCAHSTLSRILLENMKCHDPLLTCMMLAVHVCCCTNRTNSSQMTFSFSSHNWALSFWFLNVIYLVIDLFFAEKYQYTLHMYIHG